MFSLPALDTVADADGRARPSRGTNGSGRW